MAKIIVVDDNADERMIFAAVLQYHGHEVVTAETGEQGITAAREQLPNLILMDVKLPGVNGLTATQVIRSTPATSQIPVICITSFDFTSREAEDAGCERLLRKPISPTQLMSAVDATLTQAQRKSPTAD